MNDKEKQIRFLELFEPCKDSLVKFARAISRDSETSRDLVQETVLRVYDRFETIQSPVAFKSFLFTTASRIYRRQQWRKRLFLDFRSDEKYDEEFDSLPSKEPASDRNYDIQLLQSALQKLPEKLREALVLFEIIGLSIQEITDIQGGSKSGVKSRIQRGRQELADILGVSNEGAKTESEQKERMTNEEKELSYHTVSANGLNFGRKSVNSHLEVING